MHVNTPTSRSHEAAGPMTLRLYATNPSECTDPLPVAEYTMGFVQSTLVFLFDVRGGNGSEPKHTENSEAHNHNTLVLYMLLVQHTLNYFVLWYWCYEKKK